MPSFYILFWVFLRVALFSFFSLNPKRQQDGTAQELRSLVRELREVLSENLRPHVVNGATGGSFCRRRSAPERAHRTALYVFASSHTHCTAHPHLRSYLMKHVILLCVQEVFSESRGSLALIFFSLSLMYFFSADCCTFACAIQKEVP